MSDTSSFWLVSSKDFQHVKQQCRFMNSKKKYRFRIPLQINLIVIRELFAPPSAFTLIKAYEALTVNEIFLNTYSRKGFHENKEEKLPLTIKLEMGLKSEENIFLFPENNKNNCVLTSKKGWEKLKSNLKLSGVNLISQRVNRQRSDGKSLIFFKFMTEMERVGKELGKKDLVKMRLIVIGYLNTFHTLSKPISNIYSFPLSAQHLVMTFMMICSIIAVIYNSETFVSFSRSYVKLFKTAFCQNVHSQCSRVKIEMKRQWKKGNSGKVMLCKQIRASCSNRDDFSLKLLKLEGKMREFYHHEAVRKLTWRRFC